MKKYAFLLFLLFDFLLIHAQPNLDSLRTVWNDTTAPDSSRTNALQIIAWDGYVNTKPDSSFYFAQMLFDFAQKRGLRKEMAIALRIQGKSYYVMSDYPQAMEYYQQSKNIFEGIGDRKGLALILNSIGLIYSRTGNYPAALDYYHRSLEIKENIPDKRGMAQSLNNIGIIYDYQGQYPKALEYYQRCYAIYEQISDKQGMAQILNNIGIIYDYLGDYVAAMEYYRRSMDIFEEISDKRGLAGALHNIGLIYTNQGDDTSAMEYYLRSLAIYEEIAEKRGIALTLSNIGIVYSNRGEYAKAMDYYQRCLSIFEEISDKRGMASTLTSIGMIDNDMGNYQKAVERCKEGLNMAEEIYILEVQRNACQCLYDAFKAMGNAASALEYHESITRMNDSLQIEETSKKLQQMEFARRMMEDSLVQEQEKLRIKMVHDAEVRKKNRTKNIFIVSASFLLIGAIGLYRRVVYIKNAKAAIETEKERSDHLLLNILPAEIAEELKLKGRAEARNFDKVSIIFTDFKDFTSIAEKLSAEELVGEINTCFKSFDGVCKKYGIEKIKTIGDSYMAAGGLPVPTDDSVRNTVLAGLEMAECMGHLTQKHREESRSPFEMRIGIHTGPVVAGIVGTTKFQYDIWGDTVNTASRIENSGEIGKVNISQSTYEFIKDDPLFRFYARGKVKTKGKGDLEMWFVEKVT